VHLAEAVVARVQQCLEQMEQGSPRGLPAGAGQLQQLHCCVQLLCQQSKMLVGKASAQPVP